MHNKRIGRDDLLKIEACHPNCYTSLISANTIQWARTPPSASWRFDSGRERERAPGRRSPRRGGRSPSPRRSRGGDFSPRKDDRRDRDYDRRDRGDRSRSPDDRLVTKTPPRSHRLTKTRDRDAKREDDREDRENGANGEDRKGEFALPRRPR
jgi:hypothetical protein